MVSQKLLGTKLQVVWPDLIVRWSQEAYGGVQGLSELVMSSVEHRCHGCWELLQDNHVFCIVKYQLAFVIINPHSHFSNWSLPHSLTWYVPVVVPRGQIAVLKLHAPWVPVSAQLGALVIALSLKGVIGYTHSPGWAAPDINLPVTLTCCDGRGPQSTAYLIKLKGMFWSWASGAREGHAPPLWCHSDQIMARLPVDHYGERIWKEWNGFVNEILIFCYHQSYCKQIVNKCIITRDCSR